MWNIYFTLLREKNIKKCEPRSSQAALSLGVTLGAFNSALARLWRLLELDAYVVGGGSIEPAAVAGLGQYGRWAGELWQTQVNTSIHFDHLEDVFDALKNKTTRHLSPEPQRPPHLLDYYVMAQRLYELNQAAQV